MAGRMIAPLLAFALSGLAASAEARRGPNFIPWDQAAKLARDSGKPVAVYSVVDANGSSGSTVNADWSINECTKLKEAREFIWTRCDSVKLARLVKVKEAPPRLYFFDCDMERFHSSAVSDLDSVEEAFQDALDAYSSREIAWEDYSEEAVKSATSKRFVILAFTHDRDDCVSTMKLFDDRTMVKHQSKILYMQLPYVRDSEEARRWGVVTSPAYLLIDPNEDCKVLERLQGRRILGDLRSFVSKGLGATLPGKGDRGSHP